jgi:hypothetical protein
MVSAIPRILLEASGIRVVASGLLLAATGFPLPMLRIVMNPCMLLGIIIYAMHFSLSFEKTEIDFFYNR